MKIAIPVDEKKLESKVCQSFGRAPYLLIFDTERKESTFFDNDAVESAGGAGIRTSQMIIDNKADVLLAPRLGENAAHVLGTAEIKVYQSIDGSSKDNIDAFNDGKLSLLEEIHEGFHGGRSK